MLVSDRQGGKSARIGSKGERDFFEYARRLGWNPRKSSKHDDMHNHIDAWVTVGGIDLAVDIKGIKGGIDRGLITIELLNVNGDNGWIHGKADMIAFQTHKGWELVSRIQLLDYVCKKVAAFPRKPAR